MGTQDAARIRLSEVIAALSHALDLTEGQPQGHAARSCLIGMRLATEIGLDGAEAGALYYALLLKDAGCSSNAARVSSLFGADDQLVKRQLKLVDWTRPTEGLRYARTAVAPHASPLRRAGRLALAAVSSASTTAPSSRPAASAARRSCACWSSRRPRPRRCARSTSTGTARASRTG